MSTWEQVAVDTQRLRVPGGWLYRVGRYFDENRYGSSRYQETVVYVPFSSDQ